MFPIGKLTTKNIVHSGIYHYNTMEIERWENLDLVIGKDNIAWLAWHHLLYEPGYRLLSIEIHHISMHVFGDSLSDFFFSTSP